MRWSLFFLQDEWEIGYLGQVLEIREFKVLFEEMPKFFLSIKANCVRNDDAD